MADCKHHDGNYSNYIHSGNAHTIPDNNRHMGKFDQFARGSKNRLRSVPLDASLLDDGWWQFDHKQDARTSLQTKLLRFGSVRVNFINYREKHYAFVYSQIYTLCRIF